MMLTFLDRLRCGCCGIVKDMPVSDGLKKRLRDFGMDMGTTVECRYYSPDHTVMAIALKGTVLALRRKDVNRIQVLVL